MRRLGWLWPMFLLSGCTALWQGMSGESPREGYSSSLVEFLYPAGERPPPVDDQVPVLNVPLRVGIAFVPGRGGTGLPEATRQRLLERVRDRFVGLDYVRGIEVIPDGYLAGRGGFDALDQVARLHGLDVMALVSYDQVSVAEDRARSILYWTIVGAYVIDGSRNEVSTFVDTAVFDLATRKLLLRAPGRDELESTSTLIRSAQDLRAAREASFELAIDNMTTNLAGELERFEARIKEDRSVLIARRDGRQGAGAMAGWCLALLAGLAILRARRR